MLKKLLVAALLVAFTGGVAGLVVTNQANATKDHKVTICHRDNNVNQPYGPSSIEVDVHAAVNGHGKKHTGPVATSVAVAQAMKDNNEKWGDIIPPIPSENFAGLNWTAEGQAMYRNNCQYVAPPVDPVEPVLVHNVACATVNSGMKIKVDLSVITPNAGHPGMDVMVNGQLVHVSPTETTTLYFDPGTKVTISTSNSNVVYSDTLACEPGQGGGGNTPTTPETEAPVALPNTGDNTAGIVAATSALAGLVGLVGAAFKFAVLKQV